MDVKIKYDKLFSTFEKMMEEYSNLDHTEKSYDYWVQEKGGYVDWDVLNFYHDIEEDYENDENEIFDCLLKSKNLPSLIKNKELSKSNKMDNQLWLEYIYY